MSDLLSSANEFLENTLWQWASRTVTYQRGGSTVQVPAVVGTTRGRSEDDMGMQWDIITRDYLVRASDLVLNSQEIEPDRGDEIREQVNGKTYVYRVGRDGRAPLWEWADTEHRVRRIHTQFVGTE